jgi:membrane associated rhomboid family serine protease
MLEDRSYMRDSDLPRSYSAAMILLWVNVAVFVLQEIDRTYIHSPVEMLCMLSPAGISKGYVWQLFTFQFMHKDLWHLAGNAIGLFFLGRGVEEMIGTRRFLQAYFLSGTIGGVFQVLLGFIFAGPFSIPVVGASAGVLGICAVFGTLEPDAPVRLNFILPIRAKYLVVFSAIVAGFYTLVPSPTSWGVAHAAHFAGIGVGIAYVKWFLHNDWSLPRFRFRRREARPRELVTTPAGGFWKKTKSIPPEEDIPQGDFISKEVDPILDKIHAHGLQSLTDRERRILEAARAKMSRR